MTMTIYMNDKYENKLKNMLTLFTQNLNKVFVQPCLYIIIYYTLDYVLNY